MFSYSDGTKDGFRERALVLDFFAQVDDEVCHEQLAKHPASDLSAERFEEIVEDLAADDLLEQHPFTREYEITRKGSEAHHAAYLAICSLEAGIKRQSATQSIAA